MDANVTKGDDDDETSSLYSNPEPQKIRLKYRTFQRYFQFYVYSTSREGAECHNGAIRGSRNDGQECPGECH